MTMDTFEALFVLAAAILITIAGVALVVMTVSYLIHR